MISAAITLSFFALYAHLEDLQSLKLHLQSARGIHLFALFYLLSQILRAIRWGLLLDLPPAREILPLLQVSSIHIALSNFVPLKVGELSFPMLAKARWGVGLGRGLGAMILARALDGLVLLSALAWAVAGLEVGMGLFLLLLALPLILKGPILGLARAVLPSRLLRAIEEGLRLTRRRALLSALLSLLSWGFKVMGPALLASKLLDVDLRASIRASVGAEAAFLLPAAGWMGFGNYEIGWTAFLRGSLSVGLLVHLLGLALSALLGLISALADLLAGGVLLRSSWAVVKSLFRAKLSQEETEGDVGQPVVRRG